MMKKYLFTYSISYLFRSNKVGAITTLELIRFSAQQNEQRYITADVKPIPKLSFALNFGRLADCYFTKRIT